MGISHNDISTVRAQRAGPKRTYHSRITTTSTYQPLRPANSEWTGGTRFRPAFRASISRSPQTSLRRASTPVFRRRESGLVKLHPTKSLNCPKVSYICWEGPLGARTWDSAAAAADRLTHYASRIQRFGSSRRCSPQRPFISLEVSRP